MKDVAIDLSNLPSSPFDVEHRSDEALPGNRHSPVGLRMVQYLEHRGCDRRGIVDRHRSARHAFDHNFGQASHAAGNRRYTGHKGFYHATAVLGHRHMYCAIEIGPALVNFGGIEVPRHQNLSAAYVFGPALKLAFVLHVGGPERRADQHANHVFPLSNDQPERIDHIFVALQADALAEKMPGRINEIDISDNLRVVVNPEPPSQISGTLAGTNGTSVVT